MISIGNDIIALQLINPELTQQERFYSKILYKEEVTLFNRKEFNTLSFENFVWLAWSVKESVFKFYKRCNPEILFAPTKIIINKIHLPVQQKIFDFYNKHEDVSFNTEECYCCEINFESFIFYTRSFINDDFIFTVANNTTCFENIYWGIKNINADNYEKQSESVRSFALNKLNQIFLDSDLSIEKTAAGCPVITQQKNIPISFTHHGKFVGYAFAINS